MTQTGMTCLTHTIKLLLTFSFFLYLVVPLVNKWQGHMGVSFRGVRVQHGVLGGLVGMM